MITTKKQREIELGRVNMTTTTTNRKSSFLIFYCSYYYYYKCIISIIMEELADAIEDAQYVNAISTQDHGPKPVLPWDKPSEEQLAIWEESV